jgi:hypothetical protein
MLLSEPSELLESASFGSSLEVCKGASPVACGPALSMVLWRPGVRLQKNLAVSNFLFLHPYMAKRKETFPELEFGGTGENPVWANLQSRQGAVN